MIQSWQKYTSSITNQTSTTELWHKVKSIRGIRSPNLPRYLIDKNGVKYSGPQDISNLLAETFANNSSDNNYDQNFLVSIPTNFNIDQEHIKTLLKTNEEEHNQPFIMSELLFVLNKCKNSAPGPDNLPNSFLKTFQMSALNTYFNYIIIFGPLNPSPISGEKQQLYQYQNQIRITQIQPIFAQYP